MAELCLLAEEDEPRGGFLAAAAGLFGDLDLTELSSVNDDTTSSTDKLLHGLQVSPGDDGCLNRFFRRRPRPADASDPLARFQSSSVLPSFLASAVALGFHLSPELLFCGVSCGGGVSVMMLLPIETKMREAFFRSVLKITFWTRCSPI